MRSLNFALILALSAACGSNSSSSGEDAGPATDATPGSGDASDLCGDGLVDEGEECDDGNNAIDDECLNDCTLACGDGVLGASELCDTGIADGMPGACPTDCDDADACTSDVVNSNECQTMCINAAITAFADDDACCPSGGDNTLDNDCSVVCGNSVVESGETCDTGIAAGNAGACVVLADCTDGIACTTDALLDSGSCTAACTNPLITAFVDDDSCCPTNGTIATDNDCLAGCGDGVVTPPETCDTAIVDSCPLIADCVDGDSCTQDLLVSGGTCSAECQNPVISALVDGDLCCPAGANANNDSDCSPVCGNSALEAGEQCDIGDILPGDGCDENCQLEVIAPTAFRVTNIDLREPHVFASIPFFGCRDITDSFFGNGINVTFDDNTNGDSDGDGLLDLNIAQVFRPLNQSVATNTVEVHFPDCTAPVASSACTSTTTMPTVSTATNQSAGTCLQPQAGTTGPGNVGNYSPGITNATSPCYATAADTLVIDVAGMLITLQDAQFAATYVGVPATDMVNGLLIGFLSEANADTAIIPVDTAIVGGDPLSSIMPGGTGSCNNDAATKDVGPGGVTGWWMALNYQATAVPWTD